jgi:hypothetical protein
MTQCHITEDAAVKTSNFALATSKAEPKVISECQTRNTRGESQDLATWLAVGVSSLRVMVMDLLRVATT